MRTHSLFTICFLITIILCTSACGGAPNTPNPGPAPTPRDPIIVVTGGELAAQAGLEVLAEGGSATDAALAVSLAQIVLTGGAWNSFAGILGSWTRRPQNTIENAPKNTIDNALGLRWGSPAYVSGCRYYFPTIIASNSGKRWAQCTRSSNCERYHETRAHLG